MANISDGIAMDALCKCLITFSLKILKAPVKFRVCY